MDKTIQKVFKILTNVSLYSALAFGILVVMIATGVLTVSQFMITFLAMLLIVSICTFIAMPWAKRITLNTHKKVSLVMLIACGVFCLQLLICVILVINMIYTIADDSSTVSALAFIGTFNFTKFVIIFAFQYIIASIVINTFFNFGYNLMPLQIMTDLSFVTLDLTATYFVSALKLTEDGFNGDGVATIFKSKAWITMLLISLVVILVYGWYLKGLRKRSRRLGVDMYSQFHTNNQPKPEEQQTDVTPKAVQPVQYTQPVQPEQNITQEKTAREKLVDLKAMFDDGLLTESEYERKRNEIIDKM